MTNFQQIRETVDALKINIQAENIPKAIPVVETNPRAVQPAQTLSGNKVSSGSLIVLNSTTNPTFYNRKIFITSACLGIIKDAACDMATGSIGIEYYQDSVLKILLAIPIITATAQAQVISVTFPHPVPVDMGTVIQSTGTFAAGVCVRTAQLSVITDDVN